MAGFFAFAATLPVDQPNVLIAADGVVALTGGGARVESALALLEAGKARRLLITGVNRNASRAELESKNPKYGALFDCCVDLGYLATDTVGNAVETRDWAERNDLRGPLIVVTSAYHMPRALVEMSAAMPHTKFIPFPVFSRSSDERLWWTNGGALRLLAREYVKYLFVVVSKELGVAGGAHTASAAAVKPFVQAYPSKVRS